MTASLARINELDLRSEVESYLRRNGWIAGEPGRMGELWSSPRGETDGRIAVPFVIGSESLEFDAIAQRVAQREGRPPEDVKYDLKREFFDMQSYRIAGNYVRDDSVMLESAAAVLSGAKRLIRVAATTSRRPRAQIGTNFSPAGDGIARKARLTHTRRGSFVLPIAMPIDRPDAAVTSQILDHTADVVIESFERRTTRTLASALTALESTVVRSDREPTSEALLAMIESGVSKELVAAVRTIATDSGVHAFETRFHWAAGIGQPGGVADHVSIPGEAGPVLGRVEDRLAQIKPRVDESVSGQIVEIRHVPGDPLGEIALRVVRTGRVAEVRVTAGAAVIREAADWFKAGRAVLASGVVVVSPGKPLAMPEPSAVLPLDQLFLDPFRVDRNT